MDNEQMDEQLMTLKLSNQSNNSLHARARKRLPRKGLVAFAAGLALTGLASLVQPTAPDLPVQYFTTSMTEAQKDGTVTATVVTKTTTGPPNAKTTTVTIDVKAGTPGSLNVQALGAALDAASPEGETGHYVDTTFNNPPGFLTIAGISGTLTVSSVSIIDKGTLQDVRCKSERLAGSQIDTMTGEVVIFGEPTGLNPDGLPSVISLETDRDHIDYPIEPGDSLATITDNLLRQLLASGFAVSAPAAGVLVFSLNEAHDNTALMFGCDDLGIEYSIRIR
jgi:hypothetical protein